VSPGSGLRYSLRALGGRLGEQWERERRDTLFVMASILLAVLPHLPHLPWWTSAGFMTLFVWRFGLVMSGRWLPRDSVRWVAAIACAAAVFAHYETLLGRDPGVALLVLFLGLKLMEMRARRDLFVVIFLCFFLLLTAFFQSQTMLTGAITVAAVVALVTTMLTMQFGRRELPIGARLRSASSLLLQALPIAALFFVLFPRLEGPLWGLPDEARGGGTGLSESMRPGQISELTQSEDVAFRVRFESGVPGPGQLYWRGPTFGQFDGTTWKAHDRLVAPMPVPSLQGDPASTVRYAVTLEPNDRHWLFALEAPSRVEGLRPGAAMLTPDMLLLSRERINERLRYRIESTTGFRFGLNETALTLRNWTSLPGGYNPRTLELAERWRREETEPLALVQRALRMFGADPFRYTFRPPLLGRDSVDDFLFGTRAGFCEHYASAFVVLMRALDVPARVVTGYQGGELNPVDGFWVVRQADAHAWAEVWIEGRGWLRVDPTAAIAPERIERGSRVLRDARRANALGLDLPLLEGLRFNLDALANAWNQWVLSYDRGRQQRLLASLGLAFDDWQDLIGLLAAGLALLIGGVALLTLHPRRPRDPLERLYADFCERMAAAGIVREPHETSNQLLVRAERELGEDDAAKAQRIVALYNALRYGAAPGQAGDGVRHLRGLVHAFKP
jgi:transglutaminase-like putative cysteine protease